MKSVLAEARRQATTIATTPPETDEIRRLAVAVAETARVLEELVRRTVFY